jgi:RNA polymerase sigma-70 factor, ECF subfamily
VRGFARRRVAQGGIDPEDIVQETLLAIHMKRHTWREDAPVTPWLYAIARHKLVDALRRRGRRVEIAIGEITETFAEPEPETISAREVGRVLETLAPGQRSVVAAVSIDGLSISETAKSLGMTETAVRVALHRGLAAIAQRFGRH